MPAVNERMGFLRHVTSFSGITAKRSSLADPCNILSHSLTFSRDNWDFWLNILMFEKIWLNRVVVNYKNPQMLLFTLKYSIKNSLRLFLRYTVSNLWTHLNGCGFIVLQPTELITLLLYLWLARHSTPHHTDLYVILLLLFHYEQCNADCEGRGNPGQPAGAAPPVAEET